MDRLVLWLGTSRIWNDRIALRWGVQCRLTPIDQPVIVPTETAAEVEFLIREAAANAVKHAAARHIALSLAQAEDEILIALKDNARAQQVKKESYTGDFEPSLNLS